MPDEFGSTRPSANAAATAASIALPPSSMIWRPILEASYLLVETMPCSPVASRPVRRVCPSLSNRTKSSREVYAGSSGTSSCAGSDSDAGSDGCAALDSGALLAGADVPPQPAAETVSMAASNSARILRVFFMVFPPSYLPAAYKKGGLFTELGWSFQSKL